MTITDEYRENFRTRLSLFPDAELVWVLLTLHKLVEETLRGKVEEWADMESIAITTVLDRFAFEPLQEGLAIYFGETEGRFPDLTGILGPPPAVSEPEPEPEPSGEPLTEDLVRTLLERADTLERRLEEIKSTVGRRLEEEGSSDA